jgi:hypothetical protein
MGMKFEVMRSLNLQFLGADCPEGDRMGLNKEHEPSK